MAKFNYLIQRHVGGPDGANANCFGMGAEWRDCGTGDVHHADRFGNTGYGSLTEARADLAAVRKRNPEYTYRLIQICD